MITIIVAMNLKQTGNRYQSETIQLETIRYDGCTKCIHTSMHADLSSISPSYRETEAISKCNAQKVLLVRASTASVSCADHQYACLCVCVRARGY